jgi:hypothetical protein
MTAVKAFVMSHLLLTYSGDGRSRRSSSSTADWVSSWQTDLRPLSLVHLLKPLLEGCPG